MNRRAGQWDRFGSPLKILKYSRRMILVLIHESRVITTRGSGSAAGGDVDGAVVDDTTGEDENDRRGWAVRFKCK